MAAHHAAGTPGFTSAWLWDQPELSDMTLLLATKGGCDLLLAAGVQCTAEVAAAVQRMTGLTLLHAEAKQAVRHQAVPAAGSSEPSEQKQRIKKKASPPALAAEPEGPRIIAYRHGLATTSSGNGSKALPFFHSAGLCWAAQASTFGRASSAGGVTAGGSWLACCMQRQSKQFRL
jgi:hypothetical protein